MITVLWVYLSPLLKASVPLSDYIYLLPAIVTVAYVASFDSGTIINSIIIVYKVLFKCTLGGLAHLDQNGSKELHGFLYRLYHFV